jgi:hypothetical protein
VEGNHLDDICRQEPLVAIFIVQPFKRVFQK